jgi:hypothetical protein
MGADLRNSGRVTGRPSRTQEADPSPGTLHRRDGAAATVVGAILVVSLLVAALVVYRNSFVPVIEEKAEREFMDAVSESLLQVRADLDQHVGPLDRSRLTVPVPTSQGSATPSAPPRQGNLLSVENRTRTVTVHADDATIWERNGTLQTMENLDWQAVPTGSPVDEVQRVLDLRVKLLLLSTAQDGSTFTVSIDDANGDFAGDLQFEVKDTSQSAGAGQGAGATPSSFDLRARVRDADQDEVLDQSIATYHESESDHQVDVLDPLLGFDQILASADKPMTLEFSEGGLGGEFALTHAVRNDSSATTIVKPGGGPVETVHREFQGGFLRYEARNNFLPDQTYHLEHGALVLRQDDGNAMRSGPHAPSGRVEEGLTDNRAKLGFSVPSITGRNRTFSGAGVISVATETESEDTVRAVAPEASIEIKTDSPSAWADWADDRYQDAGLASGDFSITQGSDFVNVTIEGPSLLSSVDDVHLDLDRAAVDTELER